jgi:uncharacterized protein involved in response to NO
MTDLPREPYRIFFPIGILYGLWGGGLWIPYGMHLTQSYPGNLHAQVMIGGFLVAFASGFLMTAIPRFTGTFPAKWSELAWVVVPLLTLPVLALLADPVVITASVGIALLGLAKFAALRFLKRQAPPPKSFVFLGIGILAALLGIALQLAPLGPDAAALGRLLYLRCFMISLVLGVGSRLVPSLLGSGPLPHMPDMGIAKSQSFLIAGVLYILSFILDGVVPTSAHILGAGVVSWITFRHWEIWRRPMNPTKVAYGIWFSAWSLNLGSWGLVFFSQYNIHFAHLNLVSGLGLMTLMVATRVVLAHGGFNLTLESRLQPLNWIIGIVLAAAGTRVFAGLVPSTYMTNVVYAASLWVIALLIWGITIGRRVLPMFNR